MSCIAGFTITSQVTPLADALACAPGMRLAAEEGYFEIPRTVSLTSLADELDISPQSASERLRRGVATLLSSTLCSDVPSSR